MGIYDKIINGLDTLVVRPIGLYNKDYRFVVEHLDRNIGNQDWEKHDGYATPVGQLSNPYYNAQNGVAPFFAHDVDKNRFANYMDYIATVYGATTSIANINEQIPFPLDFDSIRIGKVSGHKLNQSLTDKRLVTFNPNHSYNDTQLGKDSALSLKESLMLAIKENDKHNSHDFSISAPMSNYFGLNSNARDNGIFEKFTSVNPSTGRYEDPTPLDEEESPVYGRSKKWGNYRSLGAYEGYYKNTPSATTQSYISESISLNKYRPSLANNNGKTNYLDAMGIIVGKSTDYNGSEVRYLFETLHTSDTVYNNEGHTSGSLIGGLKAYGESEGGKYHSYKFKTFNSGVNFGKYSTFDTDPIGVEDLLSKTNKGFMNGKYDTLVGRFHTSTDYPNDDLMSSSVSKAYGMSHGRNLLRGDAKNGRTFTSDGIGDGYDNPYCRVWTYHHQYHRMMDAIRPFVNDEPDGNRTLTPKEMQENYNFSAFRNSDTGLGSGGERLTKYGVIGYNTNAGLVNIAPKKGVDIKNCMFSIENLAWKDMFSTASRGQYETNGLSPEQKGPFGGRIMWFPPYDIKFSENVTANWNSTSFIGRGEDIYTYTNTNREGQLSFKLLIDHPAILDYWKRKHETDTSSNVDDVDSPEQELLRFFAGCEMLTARRQHKKEVPTLAKDRTEPSPTTKAFSFFIFYPNDYSGQDDSGSNLAVTYLLNGVGPQYRYDSKNGSNRDNPDMFPWYSANGSTVGGYEVRSNGISVVRTASNTTNEGVKRSYITSLYRNKGKKDEYRLAKQVGSYSGKRIEWYYRVDNKRRNEKLVYAKDYIDSKSFQLNSGGNQSIIRSTFNIDSSVPLYALTDVYLAFTDDTQAKETLKGCYNESNVNAIKNIIDNYGIKEIRVKGWASSHGITSNQSRNNDLNKNRRDTALKWLKNCPNIRGKKIHYKPLTGGVGPGPLASDVSDLKPKLYRCSEVTVYVNTEKVSTAQASLKEKTTMSAIESLTSTTISNYGINTTNYLVGSAASSNDRTSSTTPTFNVNFNEEHYNSFVDTYSKGKELVKNMMKIGSKKGASNISASTAKAISQSKTANIVNVKDHASNTSDLSKSESVTVNNNTVTRYDNESDFFKGLEMNDPFMRSKITEKIKYFDPAFHSISPEGFNARLNFLHQCTRQGPTIAGSDLTDAVGVTANNLSFGRPPVCVLRIGDFYYTKIIITSMSIDYDPLVWDLNHEGIGVMPMIANVSLSFHFIGGSNLSGPIARLQNAISFNYYANSEVYDDRAEQVTYDDNGGIVKYKTFPY